MTEYIGVLLFVLAVGVLVFIALLLFVVAFFVLFLYIFDPGVLPWEKDKNAK